jgi:hypothetical protein
MPACARELHLVPEWWPSKREALYLEGEAFLSIDRARDAEAAWTTCVDDDPLHPSMPHHRRAAAEGLIKLYAAQERWDEANAVAWKLYDRVGPSERPGVLILRLRTEVQRISPETRAKRLWRYVVADPQDWHSRRGLARAELSLGQGSDATLHIVECLKDRGEDIGTICDWLEILMARGDLAGLEDALRRLPAKADDEGRVWALRGFVRQTQGDGMGAVQAYRRAAGLRPHDEELLYRLALAERRVGQVEASEESLSRSKALRDARAGLLEALQDFGRVLAPAGDAAGPRLALADATDRLASLCTTLGLRREAEALRSLVPQP